MYYIVQEPESKMHYIKNVENADDGTYRKLEKDGFNIKGQFGREDYAKHWVDWYNGDMTYKEHRKFLDLHEQ